MQQSIKSLLIWFQIPHCNEPLRNHYLLSFGVISEENIHTYLKIFLKYPSLISLYIYTYDWIFLVYLLQAEKHYHDGLSAGEDVRRQLASTTRHQKHASHYMIFAWKQLLYFYKHMVFMLTCNGLLLLLLLTYYYNMN